MKFSPFLLFLALVCSCSGGGDSGAGGGSSSNNGNSRSVNTGVRLIHAGLDVEPVDLKIADKYVNRASFLTQNFYSSVKPGNYQLFLERANSPGVMISSQLVGNFLDKTEYTILLYGQLGKDSFRVALLEEPIARPELSEVRLQFINLLEDSSPLTLNGIADIGPVAFGTSSGYITIPTPANTLEIFSINSSKRTLTTVTVEFIDRGENTIVVGGSQSLGVVVARAYKDLD